MINVNIFFTKLGSVARSGLAVVEMTNGIKIICQLQALDVRSPRFNAPPNEEFQFYEVLVHTLNDGIHGGITPYDTSNGAAPHPKKVWVKLGKSVFVTPNVEFQLYKHKKPEDTNAFVTSLMDHVYVTVPGTKFISYAMIKSDVSGGVQNPTGQTSQLRAVNIKEEPVSE